MKLRRDVFKFNRVYKTIVIYVLVAMFLNLTGCIKPSSSMSWWRWHLPFS